MAKKQMIAPEGLEMRYERYRGILKDLTIMSDMFMRNVFKKRECTEYAQSNKQWVGLACEYPPDPIKSWKKLRNDAIIRHVPKKVD